MTGNPLKSTALHSLGVGFCLLFLARPVNGQSSFVNWESPHVHPLEMTPEGARLLAVNTSDHRLEVFDLSSGHPTFLKSIPVGLEPVSVRCRLQSEAWVINHISDSISIVDLASGRVVQTIQTGDEPTDVVFAGSPIRAFVCVSQFNELRVFDPENLGLSPLIIPIQGEDPRSLATDGERVYAAVFESGNRTTILSEFEVSNSASPYGGQNPPPNDGALFDPPISGGLSSPPTVGMIVRKDSLGRWMDDNEHNWSSAVTWDLHDHDLAIIDADSLAVTYASGLMNLCMTVAVRATGEITVAGTESLNELRFEPNLRGIFSRVLLARVNAATPEVVAISDLNPHLDYSSASIPVMSRQESIGDPRGFVWQSDGTRGFVSGMGSNNVIVIDAAGLRLARIDVGTGPTGLVLDEGRQQLYVLNKFDSTISRISLSSLTEIDRSPFFDPTPVQIKRGRTSLYDTHKTSGLGHVSCASCHPDGRTDHLAWDLGDPAGQMQDFQQTCITFPVFGTCDDWHPMKGPMVTQTLVGVGTAAPLHWRGERANLSAFNVTFEDLQAADAQLTVAEMADFTAFLSSIRMPPNPYRNFDGSLKTSLGSGNPSAAITAFSRCSTCHFPGQGFTPFIVTKAFRGDSQSFNTSHLRDMYEKTGFDKTRLDNNRGFGFLHDGHVDTLFNLMSHPVFGPGAPASAFVDGPAGIQQRLDVEAFMLSEVPTSGSTHASIGVQSTLVDFASAGPAQLARLDEMEALVDAFQFPLMGLIVKTADEGRSNGFYYLGDGLFQSDRADMTISSAALRATAVSGTELTYTMVLDASRIRLGVDRDEDGFFDGDELDNCSDPADAASTPVLHGDLLVDGIVDVNDVALFTGVLINPAGGGDQAARADMNCDGEIDGRDVERFVRVLIDES